MLEVLEEGWRFPRGELDLCAESLGEDAWEVFRDATAGDVGHAGDDFGLRELLEDGEVGAVLAHESGTGFVFEFVDILVGAVLCDFKEELASERVAVGVEAVGGEPEEDVARFNLVAGDDVRAVDDADDEAGKVVLALGVEAGHLCGFAADEGATVGLAGFAETLDDLFHDAAFELAGGEVVQEEEGCGTLHGDVVHAVVDEVAADGVVDAELEGDFEFCADTVGAGDEDGVRVLGEVEAEEAAEAANFAEDLLVEGFAREHFDALLGPVPL